MRQVQTIMDQVSRAVEFVFLFTLLGGLLVLQAAIAATQDERRFDAAILRTLGASREAALPPRRSPSSCVLGALAGRARGGGRDGDRLGARRPRVPHPVRRRSGWVWLYGMRGGGLVVTLAGWLGTRDTARQPPLAVIRQLG